MQLGEGRRRSANRVLTHRRKQLRHSNHLVRAGASRGRHGQTERPCGDTATRWEVGLALPGEVVADVGIAVGGIIPQARVEGKRLIQLVDLRARIADRRRDVDTRRRLRLRQRWRGLICRDVSAAAASRPAARAARGRLLCPLAVSDAFRAAHALHDDGRSIAVGGRRRLLLDVVTLDVVFLRAGRRRCGCPKDKNGSDGKGRGSG
jgi:hypothetical protein